MDENLRKGTKLEWVQLTPHQQASIIWMCVVTWWWRFQAYALLILQSKQHQVVVCSLSLSPAHAADTYYTLSLRVLMHLKIEMMSLLHKKIQFSWRLYTIQHIKLKTSKFTRPYYYNTYSVLYGDEIDNTLCIFFYIILWRWEIKDLKCLTFATPPVGLNFYTFHRESID